MTGLLDKLQRKLGGRYVLEREINRGGMATVYVARDGRHDRQVAVKILNEELGTAVGAERFLSEIKLVAGLQHPHILPLYDSGGSGSLLYYVMPCVQGESLRDRLDREKQLSVNDAVSITREVADALAYAHSRGVVHRDIKPGNILLEAGHAIVADFGIARAIQRAASDRITETGLVIGTAAYMSPEQASGETEVDGRSDVYSLACVLYEMLAGVPPYTGPTIQAVITKRFRSLPPKLRSIRSSVPSDVEAAVERALAPVPADRFTAQEFCHLLRLPGAARSSGQRWSMSHLRLVAAALGALVLAAIAVFAFRLPSGRGAALDPALHVILPFSHQDDAAPRLLTGDQCELLLYEAFSRWEDVSVVNDLHARDASMRGGRSRMTLDRALDVAKKLGAGRLVWGEVREFGDSIHVSASLYDVRRGARPMRRHSIRLGRELSDARGKFAELADVLLLPGGSERPPPDGPPGPRSVAALQAYHRGRVALADWNMEKAAEHFRAAIELDGDYAVAHLWLAQVLSWAGEASSDGWLAPTTRAVALRSRLSSRDSVVADALLALARGNYPRSCELYRSLIERDSLDFAAWFGMGECQAKDRLVIPDASSPSRWRFRTSQHAAIQAYVKSLDLVPSFQAALGASAYSRLPRLLYANWNYWRDGYAVRGDSMQLAAFAALVDDTLSFVPYPVEDVFAGRPGTHPASAQAAVGRNRELLRAISSRWVRAFPQSGQAHEALALALEANGEISAADESDTSAMGEIRRARALARNPAEALRFAIGQVRMSLELYDFAAARVLADSLLGANSQPPPAVAADVAGLASLTGRVHRAADLMKRSARAERLLTPKGSIRPPILSAEAALALSAYAAVGAPADSVRALFRLVDRLVASLAEPKMRPFMRSALLDWPSTMAFPTVGVSAVHRSSAAGNFYLVMQWALARGDTSRVRKEFAKLADYSRFQPAADYDADALYIDAWLRSAIGDTATAVKILDASLGAMPTMGTELVSSVWKAAGLVRSMALRAELAARMNDDFTAQRWAAGVAELWKNADAELEPVLVRMRSLASAGATPRGR